jgi:hypothetical protein
MKEILVAVEWTANDEEQAAVVESHGSSEENAGCDLDRRRHRHQWK